MSKGNFVSAPAWRHADEVSVVIPVYNRPHGIQRSIASVLRQTHSPREIVIVDDASTDDTVATIRALDNPRIRLIRHEQNLGAAAARNTGVTAAAGSWIAFLDSDDEWAPEKLAQQIRRIADAPLGTAACITGYTIYDERYQEKQVFRPGPQECTFESLVWGCALSPGSTLLVSRQALLDVGPFDTRMRRFEDWDWLIRFRRKHVLISEPAPLTNIHKANNPSLARVESSIAVMREKHRDTFYHQSWLSGRKFDSTLLVERAAGAYYSRSYMLLAIILLRAIAAYPLRNAAFFRMLTRRARLLLWDTVAR